MSVGDDRRRLAAGQRRPYKLGLRLSDSENTMMSAAAARTGQKTAAWLIEAGQRAAEGTLYTRDEIRDAIASGAALVSDDLGLSERDADLLLLVLYAVMARLDDKDIDLDTVIRENYPDTTPAQVRGWWTSWT